MLRGVGTELSSVGVNDRGRGGVGEVLRGVGEVLMV